MNLLERCGIERSSLADVVPNDVSVDVVSKKEEKRRKKKKKPRPTDERVARARARKRGRTLGGGLQKQLSILVAE